MQFWLSWNNNEDRLLLPVNPSLFEMTYAGINTKVEVHNIGALKLIGHRDLESISIQSHFPSEWRNYCQYSGFPSPYECVSKIKKWSDTCRPIRLIITDTTINHAMAIDSFTYGEKDGTGDVEYNLELSEYRFVGGSSPINGQVPSKYGLITAQGNRGGKSIPYVYTCISGDTFTTVARRTTGNSGNAATIMNRNGIRNPSAIFSGLELLIDGY